MKEFSKKIILDPVMQQFINEVNAINVPPIYTLEVQEARNVLLKVQETDVLKLPADIEDIKIPSMQDTNTDITIIRPKSDLSLPVIIYLHGGGWILGDKITHDRLVRQIANGANAAVIFVEFKNSPEAQYPTAIEEAYEALLYVSQKAESLKLDASKIAVVGDSVGGNMATVLTMLSKARSGPKISYQVLLYPVTDANFETESYNEFAQGLWLSKEAMKWFWDAYLPNEKERENHTASPLRASIEQLKDLPPAFVITNEYDVLRDEGEAYAHKLMEAGVPTTAVRLLGTVHDCLLLNPLAHSQVVKDAIDLINYKLKQVFNT